jgi:hypothetical protein
MDEMRVINRTANRMTDEFRGNGNVAFTYPQMQPVFSACSATAGLAVINC